MIKRKICIIVGMSLGWKTYYKHIKSIAESRSDMTVVVIPMYPDFTTRFLTHTFSNKYDIRLQDSIFAYKRQVKKWWVTEGEKHDFDHVHIVSHILAGFFCESEVIPYSVTVDMTRKGDTGAIGVTSIRSLDSFSQSSLKAEYNILSKATFINSLNTFAHNSLKEIYGIDEERILMTYPSLPMDRFTVPERADIKNKKKNILFIGNDIYRKGGDRLVKWHSENFAEIANLHLVSFESGKLGNPGRSQYFYPEITYDEIMSDLMPIADIFVLPSRFDLAPYAAIEAMAHALPLVTSNTAGMEYICRNKVNGFCIKNSEDDLFVDAIQTLLDDDELSQKMGRESRILAEQYFDSNVTYNDLLNRMVG